MRARTTTWFFAILFLLSLNINAQWEVVEQTATTDTLNGVFMVSSTAWAVGKNGTIIKSTDAGQTWVNLNSGVSEELEDVYFHNENKGFAVGIDGILRTDDGGQSWTQLEVENADYLRAVSFANENDGVTVSIGREVFLTSDGGESWTHIDGNFPDFSSLLDVDFVNDSVAYVTGNNGLIYKSTDGCKSWSELSSEVSGTLRSVSFFDQNNGVVFGSNNIFTTDGGQTWSEVETPSFFVGAEAQFINPQQCFAVGASGKIIKSIDGGMTWTEQESGTSSILRSIYFTDENTGIAVGYDGTIVRTDNGGVTSVNSSEDEFPNRFRLSQNYPNPFNPSTTISYSIPKQSKVSLKIYDILGSEITELVNGEKAVGSYKVNFDASNLSSGIYFYTLKTNNSVLTKKMMLIK